MCSVRQSPIPSAPSRTATAASCGVSALARTRSPRWASAQASNWRYSSPVSGRTVATRPRITRPVAPSIVSQS